MSQSELISVFNQNRTNDIEKQKEQIHELCRQLEENIDKIPENISNTINVVEKEFIGFYNEEINQLYQNFEREYAMRNWQKKQFLKREEDLLKQIKWVKNISQKIDDENDTLNLTLRELRNEIEDNKLNNDKLQRYFNKRIEENKTEDW